MQPKTASETVHYVMLADHIFGKSESEVENIHVTVSFPKYSVRTINKLLRIYMSKTSARPAIVPPARFFQLQEQMEFYHRTQEAIGEMQDKLEQEADVQLLERKRYDTTNRCRPHR